MRGTWQKFEVTFRAPYFDENGNKAEKSKFIKVVPNGQLINENTELAAPRSAMKRSEPEEALDPIRIQGEHGAVAYRVIQIKPVDLN